MYTAPGRGSSGMYLSQALCIPVTNRDVLVGKARAFLSRADTGHFVGSPVFILTTSADREI